MTFCCLTCTTCVTVHFTASIKIHLIIHSIYNIIQQSCCRYICFRDDIKQCPPKTPSCNLLNLYMPLCHCLLSCSSLFDSNSSQSLRCLCSCPYAWSRPVSHSQLRAFVMSLQEETDPPSYFCYLEPVCSLVIFSDL